ncbi:MAG TPA: rRNA maturation RNase YbeY [Pyrinomonadaceae bacterium]|nr:rRNA maturation RNase YbeY [Pyrinomonadaceae bacterium]
MIEVVNRQRSKRITTRKWTTLTAKMLEAIGKPESTVTIAFVSDARIRELNRRFRGIDKATDVLSFPNSDFSGADDNLGDIAISLARAEVQARENDLEFDQEIAQLILHGLLHLCGYDHETDNGEMNRLELKLRRRLKL